jgi:glycosyltransferase involved in cell wall biosynthesis
MRNISNDSSIEEPDLPEVEVLLATFNGESFIESFLESLSRQVGVRIHLRVSDDGSSDQTIKLIKLYEAKFESCEIFLGPSKGPTENFFSLIENSSHEYVALADQDDVWDESKLATQLTFFKGNGPQLICHNRAIIDPVGLRIQESQINIRHLELRNALVENVVFGNTILLNKQGIKLVRAHKSSNLVMYDSFMYLLFSCLGNVTFIEKSLTDYRIHDKNFVGVPRTLSKIKSFRFNVNLYYQQNRSFFQLYEKEISASDAEVFKKYFDVFEKKSLMKQVLVSIRAPIVRQQKLETSIWKCLILFLVPRDFI